MYRSLALTTLALLALDGLSTALAPATGLTLTGQAFAADDAEVNQAKVKRRSDGSGAYTYSFWLRTSASSASAADSADIVLSDATSGEVLESFSMDDGERGRVVFTGTFEELAEGGGGDTVTITFKVSDMIDSNGDPFGEQQEFEVSVDGLDVKPAEDSTEGWKVRARTNDAGELTVVLGNEDKEWGGAGTLSAAVSVDGATEVDLSMSEVRQRFKASLPEDFVFEDDLIMKAELMDAEGNTLDTVEQTLNPPSEAVTPALAKGTLKETSAGKAKLVTWTESDGQATALEVELIDNSTGESVIMTTDDTPVASYMTMDYSYLEFDPGESPDGYIYLCLIDLIDSQGNPTGEQMEVELTVPSYDVENEATGTDWVAYSDSSGTQLGHIGFYAYEDGYGIAMSVESSEDLDAGSANIIFEEPYEGPAPLESEVGVSVVYQLDKWVEKGDDGVPDDYTLITTMVTAEGVVLSTSTATGGGTGTVYKNGKGTKKAAAQAEQQHFQLL